MLPFSPACNENAIISFKNDVTYVDMGHICYCYFSKKIFKSLSLD